MTCGAHFEFHRSVNQFKFWIISLRVLTVVVRSRREWNLGDVLPYHRNDLSPTTRQGKRYHPCTQSSNKNYGRDPTESRHYGSPLRIESTRESNHHYHSPTMLFKETDRYSYRYLSRSENRAYLLGGLSSKWNEVIVIYLHYFFRKASNQKTSL